MCQSLPCMKLIKENTGKLMVKVNLEVNIIGSGGSRISRWGGRPPMRTLFGKNMCENERNGSCWGGGGACAGSAPLDPPLIGHNQHDQ